MEIHSNFDSVVIIVGAIAAAMLLLFLLQLMWHPVNRGKHNDVVGPNLNVIGTTYAVLLAFMLSGVWANLRAAESNAEQEANDLVNLFRMAQTLPQPTRGQLRQLCLNYGRTMIEKEWPAMDREKDGLASADMMTELWNLVVSVNPATQSEQIGLDHTYYTLSSLTEHRRIRELESRSALPGLLWAVLIVGGIVTVMCSCLFGVENLTVHMVQVFFLTFLIAIVLVAIADVDRPFTGPVHVSPQAFELAVQSMKQEAGQVR
jgi:hypothetical protein